MVAAGAWHGVLHGFQTSPENGGIGNAPGRIFVQQLHDDALEFLGNVAVVAAERLGRFELLFINDFAQRIAAKNRAAGQKHVHHRPETV